VRNQSPESSISRKAAERNFQREKTTNKDT